MVQARYTPEQLRLLDEARFCQKTDAINRRINAVYFRGLGKTQQEAADLAREGIARQTTGPPALVARTPVALPPGLGRIGGSVDVCPCCASQRLDSAFSRDRA